MSAPIQAILSGPIDHTSESLWNNMKKALVISRPEPLDRRTFMNLRLLFDTIGDGQDRLATMTHFLKIFSPTFERDELACEIGGVLVRVFAGDINDDERHVVSFIKVAAGMCLSNQMMRKSMFGYTLKDFASNMKKGFQLPIPILIALFELEITMMSQSPENWKVLANVVDRDHMSRCFDLITTVNDSLAQMLIVEWMWRVKSKLSMTPIMDDIVKNLGPLFNNISLAQGQFRSSLHKFVRTVNKTSSAPKASQVVHSEFQSMRMNGRNMQCSGWCDLNQESMIVWFFGQQGNLPDVVVFRMKHMETSVGDTHAISFTTNEKLPVFDKMDKQRPLRFDLQAKGATSFATALVNRCKNQARFVARPMVPPPNRVYAGRARQPASKLLIKAVTAEPEDEGTASPFERREMTVEQTDRQIGEFHEASKRAIEDFQSRIVSELKDIIAKTTQHKQLLAQFASQHAQLAESTTAANSEISHSVSSLEHEFEARHEETVRSRESMMTSTLEDIQSMKHGFINETNAAFAHNAIVGLSHNLGNLQSALSTV